MNKTNILFCLNENLYQSLKIEKYKKRTTMTAIVEKALTKYFENDLRDTELILKTQIKNMHILKQMEVKIDVVSESILHIFKFLARQLNDTPLNTEERKVKALYVEEKTKQYLSMIKESIENGGTFTNTLGLGIETFLEQNPAENTEP